MIGMMNIIHDKIFIILLNIIHIIDLVYTVPIVHYVPYSLVVRIPGSHPGGPGSIPGVGNFSGLLICTQDLKRRPLFRYFTNKIIFSYRQGGMQ